ncbi:AAA family ATPase [Streptomyces brasiliscabiei]|uniref:AAA family ATPase n=1 Tax=Streptomyces brasiliscabiei TaxID=2736302 RepID=UPI001C112AA1|nr:ATP-binding protein [Streptomyces brasiliscabiei]
MLINFRVANFRSLKDPQELDLRSVYRPSSSPLTVSAIYGANGSGKSNVLLALKFMHDAVTDQGGWSSQKRIHVSPFLLDEESSKTPTSLAVELIIEGIRYIYGFSVTRERVTEEWLHSFPKKKKRVLFERDNDEYYFGPSFASARAEVIKDITPPTGLYISTAAKANDESSRAVFSWFSERLWFAEDEDASRSMQRAETMKMLRSADTKERIEKLLEAADVGISEARIEDFEIEYQEDPEKGEFDGSFRVASGGGKTTIFYRGKRPEITPYLRTLLEANHSLTFRHRGKVERLFSLDQESRGTQTWFDISGMIVRALDNGNTLVVDELDTSLHPLLLAQMIKLFQREESNPHGAQLIFTTHDASLMGRNRGEELLKRDEIWFTQKDLEVGSTELYPLTDFRPRDGLNWEKRYLGGSVGGVPYISENLFDEAVSQ